MYFSSKPDDSYLFRLFSWVTYSVSLVVDFAFFPGFYQVGLLYSALCTGLLVIRDLFRSEDWCIKGLGVNSSDYNGEGNNLETYLGMLVIETHRLVYNLRVGSTCCFQIYSVSIACKPC